MRRLVAIVVAAVLGALAVGGFLLAATGILSIEASSGHWAVTEWFLQFSKRRSVATHTLTAEAPSLVEPWLVLKGAGHYETGCKPCHGAPDYAVPVVARSMTPPPPPLQRRIALWEPEELFYIVKHGIKLTGMPAWPSQQRDDEVGAMVAFLLALPQMDGAQYRSLVHGDTLGAGATAPPWIAASCARCHGADGCGRELAAFPKLADQRREYVVNALQAFAGGERHSGIMQPIAAGMSLEQMHAAADHYGALSSCAPQVDTASAAAIERGRRIADEGIPSLRLPSCRDCHGPGGERRNPAAPTLAGQHPDYLALQLELFSSDLRGGSAYAHLMDAVAPRMEREQMLDVAAYYGSLSPSDAP